MFCFYLRKRGQALQLQEWIVHDSTGLTLRLAHYIAHCSSVARNLGSIALPRQAEHPTNGVSRHAAPCPQLNSKTFTCVCLGWRVSPAPAAGGQYNNCRYSADINAQAYSYECCNDARSRLMTLAVSTSLSNQIMKARAACSTSIPSPSATRQSACSRHQLLKLVVVSP